jgi:hypothetical protein
MMHGLGSPNSQLPTPISDCHLPCFWTRRFCQVIKLRAARGFWEGSGLEGGGAAAAELATGVDGRRAPARGAATAVPAGGTRTKIKTKPSQALIFFHDAELVFTSLAAPSAKRRRHCMRYHCWSYRHCACSSLPVQEGVAITVRYT